MIKLTCRSCGSKLELTDDIDRFNCAHCGNEWIVNRSGGIVSLKAVEDGINEIKDNTKEIINELKASKTLEGIIKEEEFRAEAKDKIEKKKLEKASKETTKMAQKSVPFIASFLAGSVITVVSWFIIYIILSALQVNLCLSFIFSVIFAIVIGIITFSKMLTITNYGNEIKKPYNQRIDIVKTKINEIRDIISKGNISQASTKMINLNLYLINGFNSSEHTEEYKSIKNEYEQLAALIPKEQQAIYQKDNEMIKPYIIPFIIFIILMFALLVYLVNNGYL